ncbi:MAG TPA: acetylglutamate kinase [Steroidobacteraceae bacterium]|nr:acetylglutamate kinase [Steroidobacteraceae bacterium]
MSRPDPSIAVRALKSAAPYIRMYKNKVFVIKAGGAVFNDDASMRGLIEQVAILHQVGIRTVLVHGGGPQLDQLQATLGIETRMVHGRRVTDQKSIDVTSMVLNGLINTRILAICRSLDIEAIGLSGVDSGLIRAHRRPPVPLSQGSSESIDYGLVGDIDSVNIMVIEKLLANGLMPVVSPLSADANGTLLNINADTVAAAIGGALSAEKLVLCTGAPGILERSTDPTSIVSYTDIDGLDRLRKAGSLTDGMLPKAQAIENAIRAGVRRVHVISYKSPDSLLAEVFTNEGTGTLVVPDLKALSPAEQTAAS